MKEKNKFILQQSIIIFCLTIIFTIIVFFIKNYYFSASISPEEIEEKYLEPTVKQQDILHIGHSHDDETSHSHDELFSVNIDKSELSSDELSELIQQHYSSAAPFVFTFFPEEFEEESQDFWALMSEFLQSNIMKGMIFDLDIQMHQDLLDARGKMKQRSVKLFWYTQERQEEYLSVAIHELAHFLDIYFLEKKVYQDLSDNFYDISWESSKVIYPGQSQVDFVSWYAMTNKYEDFAESLTYYVLHNEDFLVKTLDSQKLREKYNFFHEFLLKDYFKDTDFSIDNDVEDYYRDITKIEIDIEKLLQYLKNWI